MRGNPPNITWSSQYKIRIIVSYDDLVINAMANNIKLAINDF